MPPLFKILPLTFIAVFSLSSCEIYKHAWELGASSAQANGILAVRAEPPSVGFRRLQAHAGLNPALKVFFQTRGYPEFIIEDQKYSRLALVCYYPKKNQAYMIQSVGYSPEGTRVLGPEPIGAKDKRLLNALNEVARAAAAYGN